MVTQTQWRAAGGFVLLAASAMAVYAVISDLLRNTVMIIVATSSEKVAEAASSIPRTPIILFWVVFAVLIVFALYLAALDIRYIRLQYAEERRLILRHTLQDEGFRSSLRTRTQPKDKNTSNGRSRAN